MDINVRTQLDHFPHQLTWIASVATALLCAVVTAAFMAWMPTAIGNPEDHASASIVMGQHQRDGRRPRRVW